MDDRGRQVRKDKRGATSVTEPRALQKLGISPDHWTRKVEGVGSGFWRVVGTVDFLREKATAMRQLFLRGIGFVRSFAFG